MNRKEALLFTALWVVGCTKTKSVVAPTPTRIPPVETAEPTFTPTISPTAIVERTPTPDTKVYKTHATPTSLYVENLNDPNRYLPWRNGTTDVIVANTRFRQGKLFGKGRALGDQYGPTFPFDVYVDKQATEEFRRKMRNVLPESVELIVNASPFDMGTGAALHNPGTREGRAFTISGSFDAHVAWYVYPRFRGRSLKDANTLREFVGEVNGQLLLWMIHEVAHYPHVVNRFPSSVTEATAVAAEHQSRGAKPMIVVKPDPRFDYETYYSNLAIDNRS